MNQNNVSFTMNQYQKKKPFSSFLSGIAGPLGIPLWAFYVNRGQAIASFGLRDKNGSIMEFYPANLAYQYTSKIGFRTFIKVDNEVYECFNEKNENQHMIIQPDELTLIENVEKFGIEIKVTYFTLPNEMFAGLVRRVELKNLSDRKVDLEIVDGLAQILPSGIDYGGYKAISNLLQSWMETITTKDYNFYKLRASTEDSAEVKMVKDGNFYFTKASTEPLYIGDYKMVFDEDTSLETPYQFMNNSYDQFSKLEQTMVNQVPSAMSLLKFHNLKDEVFISVIGYASSTDILDEKVKLYSVSKLEEKRLENQKLHQKLMQAVETKTNESKLDNYFKQCYIDNVLRGGKPYIFQTLDGDIGYHLYSRKHGDLERDYNFFSIEPYFYSQGNGNFRDVLQNRRNDIFFTPQMGDFNILQFTSLIQADGYNPLSIEGVKFSYEGDLSIYPDEIKKIIKGEFTPGMIATEFNRLGLEVDSNLRGVLAKSRVIVKASFGEGYWEDHFTYFYDLFDSYLNIFPDKEDNLLFHKEVPFFKSPVKVLPRKLKYVKTKDGKIRQYGAIHHNHEEKDGWLEGQNGLIKVNVMGKLITLILNKFAHLDPAEIGLSYEGNKPGWNDAMNGLPGLFGSGVSEMIELTKLVDFILEKLTQYKDHEIKILASTFELGLALSKVKGETPYDRFNERMSVLEKYRDQLDQEQSTISIKFYELEELLKKMKSTLEESIKRAKEINPVIPTYLIFEAKDYVELKDEHGNPIIGEYGLPTVSVQSFEMRALPNFLEAPARYLKNHASEDEANHLHHLIKNSELYDQNLHFYKTSVSIEEENHEIGRIRAFTKGWFERESNFLHMTYKYLLGLLKAGLYDTFYEEIKTNLTAFMDPLVYGRSPYENSSFIAPSNNPDPKKRGQGFVSRLTGSTAEVLSMWKLMFFGPHMFYLDHGQLSFKLEPKLHKSLFKNGQIEVTLFEKTKVVYFNPTGLDTYDPACKIEKMVLFKGDEECEITSDRIIGKWTRDIRDGYVDQINVYIQGGK